jgi:hypothetical protein
MPDRLSRRRFLSRSLAATVAAPAVMSVEEHRLVAARSAPPAAAPDATSPSDRWMGRVGTVRISRLICGGNLMGGYAHSRDLIYVSDLISRYHTPEKMMDTWAICEERGVNTMIVYQGDAQCVDAFRRYRARGGTIQYIAQVDPDPKDLGGSVAKAVDAGAVGAFLVGNTGDRWSKAGAVGRVAEFVGRIREAGLIAGVAGHELRTPRMCEDGKVGPDFYVKTLHDQSYWSRQRPDQDQDVIENYAIDNYWCRDPEQVASYMAGVRTPWIAYKVLAAGAIPPEHGFRYAFERGADFALVGMFDFQVAADVATAHALLNGRLTRARAWMA